MKIGPLELAACRLVVGDLPSEELPALATDALVRGVDSPTLRILAGQRRDGGRESTDLFREVLDELDIELPDPETAYWRLVLRAANDIVDGRVDPEVGARCVFLEAEDGMRESGDLLIFVGLLSELDDHPDLRDELVDRIVTESRDLLSRPGPRRHLSLWATIDRSPLRWAADPGDVDPMSLPVSSSLRSDIASWADEYIATLGAWPRRGGFRSLKAAEEFVARGELLASRLQHELGPSVHVEYYPEPIRPPEVKLQHSRAPD